MKLPVLPKFNIFLIFLFALSVFWGCSNSTGSDENGDMEEPGPNMTVTPNSNINKTSSYELQKSDLYIERWRPFSNNQLESPPFVHAIAYADFNDDGTTDVFMGPGTGADSRTDFLLFSNDGNDNFDLVSTDPESGVFGGNSPGMVHARKAILGDYNGNGNVDIFVAGHGFDQPPFPGEHPILILSESGTLDTVIEFTEYVGFYHAAASADIDNDGDIDILVADNTEPFFLINDGNGNFEKSTNRLTKEANNSSFFTAELIDVDGDGFIDLLAAGHEFEEMPSIILWGDETGFYSVENSTTLPIVPDFETIVDIDADDLDGDGKRDLILNRTGSPPQFYSGFYIQMLKQGESRVFQDLTEQNIVGYSHTTGPNLGEFSSSWFDWIRLLDFDNDGDLDILVDDKDRAIGWKNDGNGNFIREVNFN